jgi:hypothetical protein
MISIDVVIMCNGNEDPKKFLKKCSPVVSRLERPVLHFNIVKRIRLHGGKGVQIPVTVLSRFLSLLSVAPNICGCSRWNLFHVTFLDHSSDS